MRTALATALVLPLVLLPAGPAYADKPVERENYAFDFAEEAELCGIAATVAGSVHGMTSTRPVPRADGQPFLFKDVFHVTETWTTEAGSVTIRHNASFAEQKATKVPGEVTYTADTDGDGVDETITSDDVWLFTFRDSGNLRVFGTDGRLLLKATGTFKAQEQFDTLGDSQPGGRPVPGTFEVLREQTGQEFSDDFCAVIEQELT